MIPYAWFEEAQTRIAAHIQVTPLTHDAGLDIYLKWENQQVTGSFKVRGALNKVMALQPWEQQRGLVAASAGNHGQGLALAGKLAGAAVTIFASEHAVPAKIAAMRALGAAVKLVPGGYGEAEQSGLAFAAETQATWVSPYNDGQIIAGQGTLGLETLRQLPALAEATWVVPVGGGGLMAGISAALRSSETGLSAGQIRLVAVQSQASPFFHAIYRHGSQSGVQEFPSLADGLAGPLESNALTIPLIRRFVDDFILVSETQIAAAIRFAWIHYQQRIEGSAAAALAAVLSGAVTARPAIVIISGGNIQPEVHTQIITAEERT